MTSSKQVLHVAKTNLVRDGISLLRFMFQILSVVEVDKSAEDFDARIEAGRKIEAVMQAYIDNLKQVNRAGHDFLLSLPMLQVTGADEALLSEAILIQYCPDLLEKHYTTFKQKCKNLEQSQAALADAYEADGIYYNDVKSMLETIIITFVILTSFIYLVTLGPLAGVVVAAALTFAAMAIWVSWENLSNETKFKWMHTPIPEVVPAKELSEFCEEWRFFAPYKDDAKIDSKPARGDDIHQNRDDLHDEPVRQEKRF